MRAAASTSGEALTEMLPILGQILEVGREE